MTIASLALAVLGTVSFDTDTTFAVRPGSRLDVNNFAGEIVVQAWSKNELRVEASHSARAWIEVEDTSPTITLRAKSRRAVPIQADYRLTVPAWMALELSGIAADVSIEGTKGEIKVSTVNGDVHVRGGAKFISLSSVEGDVSLEGARGKIEASSVNQDIHIRDATGDIVAETVNGDVLLEQVESDNVEATTVNGSLTYDGPVKDEGTYRFSTHAGDIILGMTERSNATVSVATYSGEFESSIPVERAGHGKGKRFSFTVGDGSARVELESFNGSIQVRRPGDVLRAEKASKKTAEDPEEEHKR
jgi:DUF4097 and DUF4098 domain-containing protein YvlB